jgi:uracil-DNA glycosylase family 4
MIEFKNCSDCKECSLHESAQSPGLSTKAHGETKFLPNRAIVFVGGSPGFNEDKAGKTFIGFEGGLLSKFIANSKLEAFGDIFLAKACRCKPPQGANETQSQIRKCREHLKKDINKLWEHYSEVVLVVLGAKACYSVAHISSLTEGFKRQGMEAPLFKAPDGRVPRIFFTYSPAMLHKERRPALVHAVQDHFILLIRYLEGNFTPNTIKVKPLIGYQIPKELPAVVSCDIETYGILKGVEQTVFNPHKAFYVDGIPYDKQIVTVSFGWYDCDTGKLLTASYRWDLKSHRTLIRKWFQKLSLEKITVVGQYFKFDLMFLSAGDSVLRYWIDPRRLIVDDTLITGFLLFEQRPEKGLKEMSTLFGIADYSTVGVTGKEGNATSSADPKLHEYNCLDSAVTLCLYFETLRRIKEKYGAGSYKLSDTCKEMRNIITWDTFDLDMNGSVFDVKKLTDFHEEEVARSNNLKEICMEQNGLALCGKGSDAPLRSFMTNCAIEAGLIDDQRVLWSAKTKKISIGVENVNLFKEHLPPGESLDVMTMFQEFKERNKLITTYTKPTLFIPQKGIVVKKGNVGYVYPSWYPIPTFNDRGGSSGGQGGQIQGRFSCKKPARMTEPYSIRECSTSRWGKQGKLVEYDVNQDHLRMAALLSGDPKLMEVYETSGGESIHSRTAKTLFPGSGPKSDSVKDMKLWKKSKEYALGKTINFLVLFAGGAGAFKSSALHDAGIEVEYDFCQTSIDRWYEKHFVYKEWQDETLRRATKAGFLVLPTGWSRAFAPPGSDLSAFKGEVLNFMHQCPCAQTLQSSHYYAMNQFRKYKMKTVVCLQIYDAIFCDIYPREEQNVDEILHEAMTHPPLLKIWEKWTGRSLPWEYEKKEFEI